MSNHECPFCNFAKAHLIVHETDLTYSIISRNPINTHHAMVIPREHYESFSDLPDDLAAELIVHVKNCRLPFVLSAIQMAWHICPTMISPMSATIL